ncbi:aminoacyl-tRNA hydrolase [Bacillaceae bacterium SIJ1]|uniref:aminoacyl-tRNA hydrolase n=1 Tax=Litoribacterium kuwaitense TaxID=1398745 RepID=UPI0013EB88F8|nr:aminoacyl-tRNA hydrolase [Litoribacterium kuwaitense]NGP45803.1 aminoacyl-tRNA hydrolase [Litoribacterium kuwaitense]
MKCIVGLGNPGLKYEKTRHNIGFMVIDELAKRFGARLNREKWNGHYEKVHLNGEDLLLIKPLTYMNLSGECVRPAMDFFSLVPEDDLLVIYDDMDLSPGRIRLRHKGGAGGHNGMKSLIAHLGTQSFKRIRMGVGRPPEHVSVVDYVLQPFHSDELVAVERAIAHSADACEAWAKQPFDQVMNTFNQKMIE